MCVIISLLVMQQKASRQCAAGSFWFEAASEQDAAWRRFLRAIADVGFN